MCGCATVANGRSCVIRMYSAIQIQSVLAVMVVLNLVGLSIAAYYLMRKK